MSEGVRELQRINRLKENSLGVRVTIAIFSPVTSDKKAKISD